MTATLTEVTLDLPGTPPSYNVTAHAHWQKVRREKQKWQRACEIALVAEDAKSFGVARRELEDALPRLHRGRMIVETLGAPDRLAPQGNVDDVDPRRPHQRCRIEPKRSQANASRFSWSMTKFFFYT